MIRGLAFVIFQEFRFPLLLKEGWPGDLFGCYYNIKFPAGVVD